MNPLLRLLIIVLVFCYPASAQPKQNRSTGGGLSKKAAMKTRPHNKKQHAKTDSVTVSPALPPPTACIYFVDSFFKKDKVREVSSCGLLLTPQGEAYISRDELKRGRPYRQWLLYRFSDSCYYVVDPLAETAIRTPKIVFLNPPKTATEASSGDSFFNYVSDTVGGDIFGYSTRKYTYLLSDGGRLEQWVATELSFPLAQNVRMRNALEKFQFPDQQVFRERAGCFVVRERRYDKNGRIGYCRELQRLDMNQAESRFFDLSGFAISDILTGWEVR